MKLKAVIDSPITKAAGIAMSAAGLGIGISNKISGKKRQKEQLEKLANIEDGINKLSKKEINNDTKRRKVKFSIKKEKKFSIQGGNKDIKVPESILGRALKYTASFSKFNIDSNLENKSNILIDLFNKLGGKKSINYEIDSPNEYNSNISIYYGGQAFIIYVNDSFQTIDKLNTILDNYCKNYENADYSSVRVNSCGSQYLIELFIVKDTEKHLIYSFIKNEIKVNIIK